MVRPPLRGVSAGRIAGARPGNGRYDVGRAGYYGAPGWGTAGLVTGSVIGAAAASTYPAYQTRTSSTVGGYCATTVRTCALSNAAPVGTGCSCRTQGGRARGTVVGADLSRGGVSVGPGSLRVIGSHGRVIVRDVQVRAG
jgi:hypothetical protein